MKKRKTIILCCLSAVLLGLICYAIWANTALELNSFTVTSDKLPQGFEDYRIAHISDLHNWQIGKDNCRLLEMLTEADPDIIAVTGDLIDSRSTDTAVALSFMEKAVKIAPCYYVPGNHESRIGEYPAFKKQLQELGVTVLENESVILTAGKDSIRLCGILDPAFPDTDPAAAMAELYDPESFTLLLSHRPELFDAYTQQGFDLVLSGHAHGGQFRLPFVGGLYAPNQGFLPEYDSGLYQSDSTSMIVSRGIGNSLFPLRIGNRPEIILIELHTEKE